MIMFKRGVFFLTLVLLALVVVSAVGEINVSNVLLKVSLHGSTNVERTISLSSDEGGEMKISVVGLKGVSVTQESISFNKGESKKIGIKFDSAGLSNGVYVGSVQITDGEDVSYLPVIFEVESVEVLFDVNLDIPPQYTSISPGDKLIAQLKIFDLTSGGTGNGLGASKVDLEYKVQGIDGQVLNSESDTIVVDKQTPITKALSFPEDVTPWTYIFSVVVRSGSSTGTATSMFTIKNPEEESVFSFGDGNGAITFLIIGGAILFFLVIVGLFVYLIRDRDKLFIELRNFNAQELEKQREFLLAQAKVLKERQKATPQEIHTQIVHNVRKLKEKHKERVVELKKLQKSGDVDEMKRRLAQWKRQGYNTSMLDYKFKQLSTN